MPAQDKSENTSSGKGERQNGRGHVVFFIDKQKFKISEDQLTVRELIRNYAKEDPSETTLARREGSDFPKYQNLDEEVDLKNGMRFVVFHNSPTPVS